MPVRFRCAYCNQLLGISRRKVGTVVRCPTCAGQLTVPSKDEIAGAPQPEGKAAAPLFERSDFDDLFSFSGNPASPGMPPTEADPLAGPEPISPTTEAPGLAFDVEPPLDPLKRQAHRAVGIVLSPAKVTVLTVVLIVALALAFGVGLLVGKAMGS
jgi:hypothetical protein